LISYDAWLATQPDQHAMAHDYDSRQQFFLAYAQLYCENSLPELTRQLVMIDAHSPLPFRVNGTLANVPAFTEAFSCTARAPTVAAQGGSDACRVW
jgi:predicted metalloendopeptidase